MAVFLAPRYGVSSEKAMIAALLHDLLKAEPKKDLLRIMDDSHAFAGTAEDRDHPALWHGLAAAEIGRREYGIDDPEILQAVAFHTTGVPNLSPVGMTLYVADTLEPTRRFPGVEQARRRILELPLREAAREVATIKFQHVETKDQKPHSQTLAMLQWLSA